MNIESARQAGATIHTPISLMNRACPAGKCRDFIAATGICFHEKLRSSASFGEADPTESTGC